MQHQLTLVFQGLYGIVGISDVAYQTLIATFINPLTPMSDQNIISHHNIKIISSRQVMRIAKNIN